MGVSLAQLDQRDIARLRAELCEVIAARFAYPAFFDFRSGTLRTRPLGAPRRQEISAFVHAAILEPIEQVDLSGPEVRRYLEALFLRYLEVNHDLARGAARRRLSLMRVDVPRAAAEVQRGLMALAAGAPGDFGAPRPIATWADQPPARKGRKEPAPDALQRGADLLRAALLGHEELPAAPPASPATAGRMPATIAPQPPRPAPPGQGAWARVPMDSTAPLPAVATPAGGGLSPFAGLEGGSQSAMFGGNAAVAPSEQPTGQLPVVGLSGVMPGRSDAGRALPPDLLKMYGDYLRDMQPEVSAPTAHGETGRQPVPGARPAEPPAPPTPEQARTDAQIFSQLRNQIEAYIRLAARSYNIRPGSADPASAIDALRRSGHVDEADLRIAESILALADRVVANGGGTVDDYRQALLLYLLYHRGRLGA